MQIRTHSGIASRLCGEPIELGEGFASVGLETVAEMAADERGLVHGGFIFGLADYAAMLAVNDPNVVLGQAETRFLKPVVEGEKLVAQAEVLERSGIKRVVHVKVERGEDVVLSGEFVCYVLEQHVLDR